MGRCAGEGSRTTNRERVGGDAEKDNGNNKVRCICFLSLGRKKKTNEEREKKLGRILVRNLASVG